MDKNLAKYELNKPVPIYDKKWEQIRKRDQFNQPVQIRTKQRTIRPKSSCVSKLAKFIIALLINSNLFKLDNKQELNRSIKIKNIRSVEIPTQNLYLSSMSIWRSTPTLAGLDLASLADGLCEDHLFLICNNMIFLIFDPKGLC